MIGDLLFSAGAAVLGLACFLLALAGLGVCITFCVAVIVRMGVNVVENWDRLRQRFAS